MTENIKFLDETCEKEIRELLIGRKIIKVENDKMTLDNGVEVIVLPNEGCGGCYSGWYYLDFINEVNNAITDVRLESHPVSDDKYEEDYVYSIFVYTDGIRTEAVRVSGSDGNGYYGTGYELKVTIPSVLQ